ncbi:MAG TPA: LysR family transcriptional regulator, partial [Aquabacterium sp.]|nr:LysR family transcriptional regulator [Aquabacterium sp.]
MLRFTLRELEVFAAVATAGSVTRAAEVVALTQSAASQALDKLEIGLGAPLFDRVGRRLVLNEHGRQLLPRARALLDAAGDMQDGFADGRYRLRMGASTTIANYLLPELLAAFRARWPQAHLEMEVGNTRDIVAAVARLEVDFGFIEGSCHHPDLRVEPWREDELVVFVAPHHPLAGRAVSFDELCAADWLLREPGSGTREEVERLLQPHLPDLKVCMELGHPEAIKNAV